MIQAVPFSELSHNLVLQGCFECDLSLLLYMSVLFLNAETELDFIVTSVKSFCYV